MPEVPRWWKRFSPFAAWRRRRVAEDQGWEKIPKVMKPRTYRPIHLATLIALTVAALTLTGLAASLMWDAAQVPANLPNSPDLAVRAAQLRVDVIRNILAVGAGTGGLIALFLALRRQYVKERVDYDDQAHKTRSAEDSKHDATERRVTDLYVKAAEQLGSENAAVRLAALYSLERLGQDNPEHRQTVVNLICAYLRMPFVPPKLRQERVSIGGRRLVEAPDGIIPILDDEEVGRHHELEVRVTAQRILKKHLEYGELADDGPVGGQAFWDGADLDLTGAVLVEFDMSYCSVDNLSMSGVHLLGSSDFHAVVVIGYANFSDAAFHGTTSFSWAKLIRPNFSGAVFRGPAFFDKARFYQEASFNYAQFHSDASFGSIEGALPSFKGAKAKIKVAVGHTWPQGYDVMRNRHDAEMGDVKFRGISPEEVDPEQRSSWKFYPTAAGPNRAEHEPNPVQHADDDDKEDGERAQ